MDGSASYLDCWLMLPLPRHLTPKITSAYEKGYEKWSKLGKFDSDGQLRRNLVRGETDVYDGCPSCSVNGSSSAFDRTCVLMFTLLLVADLKKDFAQNTRMSRILTLYASDGEYATA